MILESYHIRGGKPLRGEIKLQGAKNAALPILAATVATGGESYIENCPRISDVDKMISILKSLGCRCKVEADTVIVDSKDLTDCHISEEKMKGMRSSIFLVGAILGRCGHVEIGQPGGCKIGKRPIDIHLEGLKKLGADIDITGEKIICKAKKLLGTEINMGFPSVGATENLMLAAIFAKGITTIKNCATEPEIVDLAHYLNKCGAKIKGAGTNTIQILGETRLKPTSYSIISDRIEGGTFMAAAAATRGEICILSANKDHMAAILNVFRDIGCYIRCEEDKIYLNAQNGMRGICVKTAPYPGFPTDMQSQLVAALALAKGKSIVSEEIFENRFNYVKYLKTMNADIDILKESAIINGGFPLKGQRVIAEDLRGGSALTIAGLAAEGETIVEDIYHIERGYQDFHLKLNSIGADIIIQRD